MTGPLWAAVILALGLACIALGVWLARLSGRAEAERDYAEQEAEDAYDIAERRAQALETGEEARSRARRELDRRKRLRDQSGRA